MIKFKKLLLLAIPAIIVAAFLALPAIADNPQFWCQFGGTSILKPCTGSPSVQTINASNTNVTLLGNVYDKNNSKGTVGQLLGSTANGVQYYSTSTLGLQPSGSYVTSVTGSGNINSSQGLTPNITFTGILPLTNGGTGSSTLNTTLVTEGNNLYFTNTRSQNAISLTTTGTSGASTYSSGTLNIPQYQAQGSYLTTIGSGVLGNCVKWNGTNLLTDAGAPCGSGSGGGATTTIFTNVTTNGPNFTFATSSTTGLNLNLTGVGSTITFYPQLQSGYNIPLTASTTQWNNLYNASSTFLTAVTWGSITGTPVQYDV